MISGIIKSYSIEKETGFIEATNGKEYFFDISYLKNPKDKIEIKVGSPVVFTLNIISSTYSQVKEIVINKEVFKNKGTVKFYNNEKGYGFIFCEVKKSDIYFYISDWNNPSVPTGNDDVIFDIHTSSNGKQKATNIILSKSANDKKRETFSKNDDRIKCPSCGKKIAPRIVTYAGKPTHSLCPYCASTVRDYRSGCFIATAVYKDYEHPQVKILRTFRDKYLLTNKVGKIFVKYYYKYSPSFANYVKDKPLLSIPIKKVLDFSIYIFKK
ncbi:cold shock domain-containing protein [Aliarcobacter butzleri]|uniref:cold-shock protein n=1 Tax=Aliarcobacter butzleri TaxID=28197 RepID=UPI0021B4B1AE|nr:cold shock domain-containing protein [Aliarcobacter butzleri]UXC30533.1 cold shock domain-containing protein [Aliarcobacter butzleri]